jgi:hypothetical protein
MLSSVRSDTLLTDARATRTGILLVSWGMFRSSVESYSMTADSRSATSHVGLMPASCGGRQINVACIKRVTRGWAPKFS